MKILNERDRLFEEVALFWTSLTDAVFAWSLQGICVGGVGRVPFRKRCPDNIITDAIQQGLKVRKRELAQVSLRGCIHWRRGLVCSIESCATSTRDWRRRGEVDRVGGRISWLRRHRHHPLWCFAGIASPNRIEIVRIHMPIQKM